VEEEVVAAALDQVLQEYTEEEESGVETNGTLDLKEGGVHFAQEELEEEEEEKQEQEEEKVEQRRESKCSLKVEFVSTPQIEDCSNLTYKIPR